MKYKRIILGALIAVLILVVGYNGGRWLLYGRFVETTDNAYVKADTVAISARSPGRVAQVLAQENAVVEAGDILATIDPGDYAARTKQAAADVALKTAAIGTLKAQATLADARLDAAEANLRSVEAELGLARTQYSRTASLEKSHYSSREALDRTSTAVKTGNARMDAAISERDAAAAEVSVYAARTDEAAAALTAAQAAYELAQFNEANTVIRAPVSGVVGHITVREGEYASPGRQVMALVPMADSYVVANFKETQLARLRVGEPVRIEIDAYAGAEVKGVVDSLSPASGAEFSLLPPENATGNFTKITQRVPVKIRINAAPDDIALIPGLSVTAQVDTRGADLASAMRFAPRTPDVAADDDPSLAAAQ